MNYTSSQSPNGPLRSLSIQSPSGPLSPTRISTRSWVQSEIVRRKIRPLLIGGSSLAHRLLCPRTGYETRTTKHRAADGRPTPSLSAAEPELAGIACAMKRAGTGVIQVNSDFGAGEFPLLRAAAELAQRPLSLLLVQMDIAPNRWAETLTSLDAACADGRDFTAQVGSRPIGILLGLQASRHPFLTHALWHSLDALDHNAKAACITNDRDLRRRLVEDRPDDCSRSNSNSRHFK
jgi:N-acyl-D-aspartate/D-glutamate deacylase